MADHFEIPDPAGDFFLKPIQNSGKKFLGASNPTVSGVGLLAHYF